MNWKEFLKLDLVKLTIFFFMWMFPFIVFLVIPRVIAGRCPVSIPETHPPEPFYCKSDFWKSFGLYLFPIKFRTVEYTPYYHPLSVGETPLQVIQDRISFFISILLYYLISCFIVWIYSKVKKK